MKKNTKNVIKIFSIIVLLLLFISISAYFFALPKIVKSQKTADFLVKYVKENFQADLVIEKPFLDTPIEPYLKFKVEKISLTKDGQKLLDLENIDSKVDYSRILLRTIKLERLGANKIFVDINNLQKLTFKEKEKKEKKPSFFKIDCFNALLYIKNLEILYSTPEKVDIKLLARDLEITDFREPKMVHIGMLLDLCHNNEHLKLIVKDRNNIYFKNQKLHVDNLKFLINKSEVTLNVLLDRKNNYDVTFETDKFEIDNVNKFLKTNLFVKNGSDIVSSFKDFTGDFQFKINLNNKGQNGFVKVNKVGATLIPVANIPLTISKGLIEFDNDNINFKDFKGYYGSKSTNLLEVYGDIKDYTKTADIQLFIKGIANNELARYITKLSGVNIEVQKIAPIQTEFTYKNNKMSIKGEIKPPVDAGVSLAGISLRTMRDPRTFDFDLDIVGNILNINSIHLNIIPPQKDKITLATVRMNMNIATGVMNKLEFNVPEPLPSEFFNVLLGQNIFRNGTFSGNMKLENNKLFGEMALKDTFIVGQVTFIKNMTVNAKNNIVKITSDGGIRLAKYKFDVDIVNNLVYPIIVQNAKFDADNIDVAKIIKTFEPRTQPLPQKNNQAVARRKMPEMAKSNISKDYFVVENQTQTTKQKTNEISEPFVFQPNLVVIQKCALNVKNGVYKELNFGNLHANLTFSKDGILEVKSNKFDFADGISTLKIYGDFVKNKYNIRLGGKDVDTNVISSSILNLPKEISGKADALLEFSTDANKKLNGKIQFRVKNGSIAKLGLVQYVLNVATIFRNPLAMISPTSLFDLVNIPDGGFTNINGTLDIKNNIIEKMIIKSSSPNLSSLIAGRINLETMDATIIVLTKFSDNHKDFLGALRGLSLDTISKKAVNSYKDNNINYYSAVIDKMPKLEEGEDIAHVYLTKIDGDIKTSNYISTVKKIK